MSAPAPDKPDIFDGNMDESAGFRQEQMQAISSGEFSHAAARRIFSLPRGAEQTACGEQNRRRVRHR